MNKQVLRILENGHIAAMGNVLFFLIFRNVMTRTLNAT